jgi:hypothetical protein
VKIIAVASLPERIGLKMQSATGNFYPFLQDAFCKNRLSGNNKNINRNYRCLLPTTLNMLMEIKSRCGYLGFCIDGWGVCQALLARN